MTLRGYFEVDGADGSRLGEQVARQRARVAVRMSRVARVVPVMSGKGGVGKSYVAAALAVALARRACAVGVLDADLHGPTVARMLGAAGPLVVHADGVEPARGRAGIGIVSTDLLLPEGRALRWTATAGEAHTWRGAAEASVLRELLGDVRWGALDALIVDLPPDPARLADLAALVPRLAGTLAVTIPSEESARAVSRALDAARAASVPILGIVENMVGYGCGACGAVGPLFDGDAGLRLARAFDVPLLAQLPFTRATIDEAAAALAAVADVVLGAGRVAV